MSGSLVALEPVARPTRPLRVLLLCGGSSDEHQVSLASARSVLEAVAASDDPRLAITPVVISREGGLVPPAESARLLTGTAARHGDDDASGSHAPAPRAERLRGRDGDELTRTQREVGGSLAALADQVDVVFPLLHGPNGEDGALQGLLKLMGLPFVGSGVLGSALAMDKLAMKSAFAAAGLPQVAYRGVTRHDHAVDPEAVSARVAELGLPVFVKPANLGSSIGVTRVDTLEDLDGAIATALRFDRRVIVETAASGARELELAVLGNDEPTVSGVGEIVFGGAFYDYDTKYTDGRAELIIPAKVPDRVAAAAQELALTAFRSVDAAGLARVDLFYLPDGRLLVNELNTMPGFTRHSMYPKLWLAAGLGYAELVERLVLLAMEDR